MRAQEVEMVSQLTAATDATAADPGQDTAPPAVETQPLGTESVSPAVETDSARTPETTETPDPLAELEPDTVKNSPTVRALIEAAEKSAEARTAESHRQQLEATRKAEADKASAEAYARNLQELDEVDRGRVMSTLQEVVDRVAYGDPEARQRLQTELPQLRGLAETLTRTTALRLDRQNVDTLNSYLTEKFADYRIEPEKVAAFDAALAKGDFTTRRNIEYDLIAEAAVAKSERDIRARVLREVNAEAQKTLELERQKASETAAQNGTRPTTVSGRPAQVGSYRSRFEVAQAHARGELTNAEARALYALPHSQLPEV